MAPVRVVLVEWMGYPLFRQKRLGPLTFDCGLGHLVESVQTHVAGTEFECTVVVNRRPESPWAKLNHVPGLGALFENVPATNSEHKYREFLRRFSCVKEVLFRDNELQDIGAYDFFYSKLRQEGYQGHVLFANSSVRGPIEDGWLAKYQRLFELEPDTGFCGISLNSHNTMIEDGPYLPHLQSFFIYTSMPVLERVFPRGLYERQTTDQSKGALVTHGEIALSQRILAAGLGLRSSQFPEFYFKTGFPWTIPEGDLRFSDEYRHLANLC
jgi:hypothetical protein